LIVVIPTYILLFLTISKYHHRNAKAAYEPEHTHGVWGELLKWTIPSIIIAIMIVVTWEAAHKLDPYQPIESSEKPLNIQVVALNWKWLFIYPEQSIATLNFVQFPEKTPVHFSLAADGSPMNSFWIPQLSGQIYAMTAMVTPLHIMADEPGEYHGKAAEINGQGYAGMTFIAKATTKSEFEHWVETVKESPQKLTVDVYNELIRPSEDHSVVQFSHVDKDLFHHIVNKYMFHKTSFL
jgi:cytochrome o ubiquinol oxidase subunit II